MFRVEMNESYEWKATPTSRARCTITVLALSPLHRPYYSLEYVLLRGVVLHLAPGAKSVSVADKN